MQRTYGTQEKLARLSQRRAQTERQKLTCAVEAISVSVNLALFAGGSCPSPSSGYERVADVDPPSRLAMEKSAEIPGVAVSSMITSS